MNDHTRACPAYEDRLALMISADLSDEDLAETMKHLSECAVCRTHWQALQVDHRDLQTYSRSLQSHVQAIERHITAAIVEQEGPAPERGHWWSGLFNTAYRRVLTGVTVALVAALAALIAHMATTPFAAWAEVIENARSAVSCRYRVRNLDSQRSESVKLFSELGYSNSVYEDGELVERMCVDFTEMSAIHLIPPFDRGVHLVLGKEMLRTFRERNPAYLFEHLATVEHDDLGTKRIDGRRAVGIRASGRNLVPDLMDSAEFEVWANPETKWPVRIDIHGTSADGGIERRVRFYDFEWNAPVERDAFRPEIPTNYDMATNVPFESDEDHTIDALRAFAQVTDGRYPPTLAYLQLTAKMWKRMGQRVLSMEVLPALHQVRAACEFYGRLVREEKEAVYFGDRVRPGESDRVLLRWRVDDERYRVVYGDLNVETIDGSMLLERESR